LITKTMSDSSKRRKHREIIASGTLQQFLGLVEFEQMRAGGANPDYDDTSSLVEPFSLYGPVTPSSGDKESSQYWLVVSGYHSFLGAYRRGESAIISSGLLGYLESRPGMTLDELDREARKQQSSLSRILGVGEMWASEVPGGRIRVVFNASRFRHPASFGEWADSFVAEMERQGFIQQSTSPPEWLTMQPPEQVQTYVPEVVRVIEEWIPKQRFRSEEAYEAALAEHLEGRGITAPEQQGASAVDILAIHGIGIEIKFKPDRSEYDRLVGQIVRHLREYGVVIVLIIRPDKRDLLDEYRSLFADDSMVVFITK
jgi:hypothetical protein